MTESKVNWLFYFMLLRLIWTSILIYFCFFSTQNDLTTPEEVSEECLQQMSPPGLYQRLTALEMRLERCGGPVVPTIDFDDETDPMTDGTDALMSSNPCPSYDPAGQPHLHRRISLLEGEVARQKNALRGLRQRIAAIGRQYEGKSNLWDLWRSVPILLFIDIENSRNLFW